MKRFALLLLVLLVAGCSTPVHVAVGYLDYTPYTQAGFYITSGHCPDGWAPVGELEIVVPYGAQEFAVKSEKRPGSFNDGVYGGPGMSGWKEPTPADLLDFAVSEAAKKGAEGLAGLKITKLSATLTVTATCIAKER